MSDFLDSDLKKELGDTNDLVIDPTEGNKTVTKQMNQRQKHKEEKKNHMKKLLSNSKQKELKRAEQRRLTIEKSKRRNEIIANFKQERVPEDLKGIISKTSQVGKVKTDNERYKEALENKERGLPYDQEIIDKINKKKEQAKKIIEMPLYVPPPSKPNPEEQKNPIETPAEPAAALIQPDKKPLIKPKEEEKKVIEHIAAPAINVQLKRPEGVQEQRAKLPALDKEQEIIEILNDPRGSAALQENAKINDILIIQGSTGSGKTTQVPQFLYEAGYGTLRTKGRIAVTEPRRIAAINMSKRVAYEMGFRHGAEVGYQIRHDRLVTDSTVIKFVTDGVLLKELEQDLLLTNYSVVIIDEAHERTVNTDVLIGMLSMVVRTRREKHNKDPSSIEPLKLIIMSATLDIQDFTQRGLFNVEPPVISVEGRMFDVSVHFAEATPEPRDVNNTLKRLVDQLHETLPPGTMLVFVPGKQDIMELVSYFRSLPTTETKQEEKDGKKNKKNQKDQKNSNKDEKEETKENDQNDEEEKKTEVMSTELPDIDNLEEIMRGEALAVTSRKPMLVLPLYSLLDPVEQSKVFLPPPEGKRVIIFSTNVAETSLTIPGVRYVVDTGLEKTRVYDFSKSVVEQKVSYISKASAEQRKGRAGRTMEGICFRLYSSGVFQHKFKEFSDPEILKRPVEEVVLLLKSMGLNKVKDFPLPTPLSEESIANSEKILQHLSAIETVSPYKITQMGKTLAAFPISPRLAKILILARTNKILDYAAIVVAALTVREPFEGLREQKEDDDNYKSNHGDVIRILTGFLQYQRESDKSKSQFCLQQGLRYKAMQEMQDIRVQLAKVLAKADIALSTSSLPDPSELDVIRLRQAILGGYPENVARRDHDLIYEMIDGRKAQLNGRSLLAQSPPLYIVYTDVVSDQGKLRFQSATPIDSNWLVYAGSPLLLQKEDPSETNYDPKADRVFAKISATFAQKWRVENVLYPSEDPYRFFAGALLRGNVFEELKEFVPEISRKLVSDLVEKNASRPIPQRNMMIVVVLKKNKIATKKDLLARIQKDPNFLLTEYLYWIEESSMHTKVQSVWLRLRYSK